MNKLVIAKCFAIMLSFVSFPLLACAEANWLNSKISELKSAPVANPPAKIIERGYQGQRYYYLPAKCCDRFSALFTAKGKFVCSPDGGFAGRGDGQCPDFVNQMRDGGIVWEDKR